MLIVSSTPNASCLTLRMINPPRSCRALHRERGTTVYATAHR